jgi:hypothetical protein
MVDVRFVDQARRDLASLLSLHPELEEDDVLRQDMIEGETGALELLDKLIEAEREAKGLGEGTLIAVARLEERKYRFAQRQIALRKYIMQIMEAAKLKKAERPAATVSIAAGRPKVVIIDETRLPDFCVRIKREPNKEAIAKAFKEGNREIPGATLSNPEPVLRIS